MVKGLPLLGNTVAALRDVCELLVQAYHLHGPVFRLSRLGREATVLAGLEANAFFLEHEQELFYSGDIYKHLSSEGGTPHSFIALDGSDHRHLRRQMRLGYSRQLIAAAVPGLVEQIQATAQGWAPGQRFDALELMANLAMQQAGAALLGHTLAPGDDGPLNAFSKTFVGVGVDIQPPILLRRPAYQRGKRRFFELIDEIFAEHTARGPSGERPLNQIDIAHRATYRDGMPLSEIDARACTYFSLVMNAVYTNRVCANLLYALLKDAPLIERVLAEVDAVCDAGPVTIATMQRMPVLRAAIRESLRRYPIPAGIPRHAKQDFEFGGYTIRKGTKIYVAASVTHFLPELFPNPYAFDVDRFLPPRDEQRQPRALLPFGAGSHACLGSSLATLFAQISMIGLLRVAQFELAPAGYRVKRAADPMPGPSGMGVRVRPRPAPAGPAGRLAVLDDEQAALFAGAGLDRAQQDALVARATRKMYGPSEIIIRQGDEADAFYILLRGAVDVVLEQAGQPERPIAQLAEGAFFGEIGLLQNVRRTATVRAGAAGPAEVLVLDRDSFLSIVEELDLIEEEIAALLRRRSAELALARALPSLSREQIAGVAPASETLTYRAGETIIHQGDPASQFYIIVRGEVEVLSQRPSGPALINRCAAGEYFGEIGLLQGRPRTATVRAGPQGAEVLALGIDAFQALVSDSSATESAIAAVMMRRLLSLAG
jgi:cytochrome P450/CRP-like cAMP-binding protein